MRMLLDGYQDWYRLRSLLLRVAESGGPYLSAQDQTDAKMYAARLTQLGSANVPTDDPDHGYRPVQTIEGIVCGYCKGPSASPRHYREEPMTEREALIVLATPPPEPLKQVMWNHDDLVRWDEWNARRLEALKVAEQVREEVRT